MKLYLSSYKLGNELEKLRELIAETSGNFGYVPNSTDFIGADPLRKEETIQKDMSDLMGQGANVEILDLRLFWQRK